MTLLCRSRSSAQCSLPIILDAGSASFARQVVVCKVLADRLAVARLREYSDKMMSTAQVIHSRMMQVTSSSFDRFQAARGLVHLEKVDESASRVIVREVMIIDKS